MSISYNVYVGPYIEILDKEYDAEVDRLVCPNPDCQNYKTELRKKFCPECGKERESMSISDELIWDCSHFFIENFGDEDLLTCTYETEKMFLIANRNDQGGYRMDDFEDDIDLSDPRIQPQGEDWERVKKALDEWGMSYRYSIGVIRWSN